MTDLAELREKASALPRGPGVYLMKDGRGRVLYVGKAKDLRARVLTYFQAGRAEDRQHIEQMLPLVRDVEVLTAPSEVEALLLENRLIKDLQPPHNRALKDGKSYPYIVIEKGTDYPSVLIARGAERAGGVVFGPFIEAWGLRQALSLMQRVFRFRTCELDIRADEPRWRHFRPCLLHAIGCCSAPCSLRISKADYRRDIAHLKRFLRGKRKETMARLEREMHRAAETLRYERAAQIRDQIRAIESLARMAPYGDFAETPRFQGDPAEGVRALRDLLSLEADPRTVEGVDIAHLQGGETVGSIVVFVDGVPVKDGYRRYRVRDVDGVDDCASIREVVSRRAERVARGDEVQSDILLVDGGRGQLAAACRALARVPVRPAVILSLAKREERVFREGRREPYRLERRDPALRLLQYVRDEAHRFAQHYHHLLRGKAVLPASRGRRG